MATPYDSEPVDRLPFGSAEKAARYATERYVGATGLNWWRCDPTLQFLMRYHLTADELAWADPAPRPHGRADGRRRRGAGRASPTSNPPRLERYDRWGHDVSEVVLPPSFLDSRRDVLANSFTTPAIRARPRPSGVRLTMLTAAHSYLLDQAEIGMACALGTGGDMVVNLVRQFAPADIRERVMAKFASGEWAGQTDPVAHRTHRRVRPRRARDDRDARRRRVADQRLQVVRVERQRRGVGRARQARGRARQRSAASPRSSSCASGATAAATASASAGSRTSSARRRSRRRRSSSPTPKRSCCRGEPRAARRARGDGKGLARMMEMTNGARLGIAMMGLGCARRALVEALCYARRARGVRRPLVEQPLMQRKLAEMIVEVEAAQALVFDGYDPAHRLRIGAPLIKLRASRLGITARQRRDRGARRQRVRRELAGRAHPPRRAGQPALGGPRQHPLPRRAAGHRARAGRRRVPRPAARRARPRPGRRPRPPSSSPSGSTSSPLPSSAGRRSTGPSAEARLFPLAQLMVDVYAGALLLEHAGYEQRELGTDRKSLVARLYARRHLADHGPLRASTTPAARSSNGSRTSGTARSSTTAIPCAIPPLCFCRSISASIRTDDARRRATRVAGQAPRACSRSATRSAADSMPTRQAHQVVRHLQRRAGDGGVGHRARGARSSAPTAPSDSASVNSSVRAHDLERGRLAAAHGEAAPSRRSRASAWPPRRGRGGRGAAGTAPARRPGGRRAGRRSARAFAQCRSMRTASVFTPAQHEVAVERRRHRAGRVLREAQPLGQLVVVDGDEPADDVAVAAEVLRGRVHDDVGAERQRLLQVRRGERVVDDAPARRARGRARRRPRCRRSVSSGLVGVSSHTSRVSAGHSRGERVDVGEVDRGPRQPSGP